VFGLGLLGHMIYVIDYGCSWVEVAEWVFLFGVFVSTGLSLIFGDLVTISV
jgi:hypothetical protein